MEKIDFKKLNKELYQQKEQPSLVQVPAMPFVAVKGCGDPNTSDGEYQQAIGLLYGISYAIKMSHRNKVELEGWCDFTVPPLEGLWSMEGMQGMDYQHKEKLQWIAMLRLPEFVTPDIFAWAKQAYLLKHPEAAVDKASYWLYEEGLCAQILHKGSFDEEPATLKRLHAFLEEQGYLLDFTKGPDMRPDTRCHHELYLSNPQRTKPEQYKTIIRVPVKR